MSQGHALSLTVQSVSMWPLLDIGDVIICAPINIDESHINHLVVYYLNNRFIVHRLKYLDLANKTFTTAPDNGLSLDMPVKFDCIIGVVKSRIRNGNQLDLFTSRFKIYNVFLLALAKIYVYAKHLKPKLIDWFVSASEESFRQRIGKLGYYFALYLFLLFLRIYKLNGFITRSAAINEFIVARSDIDFIVVTKDIDETLRIASLLKVVRKLCPIISCPAILHKKQFIYWSKFGGPLRLESMSWRPFGNIQNPMINVEDNQYQRTILRGALDAYKNLWKLVVELSMPKTAFHCKNISNFQKFCIDAIRWIAILEKQVSIDSFKIKRRDFQKLNTKLVNRICQNPNLINFISSHPKMESRGRAELAILYFDIIAAKLIKACESYHSTIHSELNCLTKEDPSSQFKIYDYFDSGILLKQVTSPEANKIPVTEASYPIFANADTLRKFIFDLPFNTKRKLTDYDYSEAISELSITLAYYPEHLDGCNLQIIASNIIGVVYKPELENCTNIPKQHGYFIRSQHPELASLLISSSPEKFNFDFRINCFRSLNQILDSRINIDLAQE